MPRLVNRAPSYRKYRASGRAIVTLDGQDIYLGAFGTQASRDEYDRVIKEWLANGRRLPGANGAADLYIADLLSQFWEYAKTYYRRPDGSETSEVNNYADVIRVFRKLYGRTLAADFGPLALKALRQKMIELGWCRTNINRQIGRVKHIFKWACENELVPPAKYEGLRTVAGLKAGRSDAKESEPVQPVPVQHVDAVLDYVSRQVKGMIQLQEITGMRPGEVCGVRGCDLDTTGKLWIYRPSTHKTQHHGHRREIYLGPKAIEIVKQFLKLNSQEHLFAPADAERERREKMHEARKTPMSCGNKPGSNRQRSPEKQPGEQYTVVAYCHAIAKACEVAFGMPDEYGEPRGKKAREAEAALDPDVQKKRREDRKAKRTEWRRLHAWHPHQLRHNAATRLRKEFGLEAAQVILGHKTLAVTEVYAEKNVEAAKKIMGGGRVRRAAREAAPAHRVIASSLRS